MKQEIETTIAEVTARMFGFKGRVELTRPDEQFGDFATNIALRLAKPGGWQNDSNRPNFPGGPREIAEAIAVELQAALPGKISTVSVAGPGFINLTLTEAALQAAATVQPTQFLAGKTIITEYSDPNPFKPLHAGHLYTTLVGDTISRLIESAGAKTIRINYGGDVGLHTARSMWAIIKTLGGELPEKMHDVPEAQRPTWLGARYAEGTAADQDDPIVKAAIIDINKRVYQLHTDNDHESPFAQIYWTGRQWSYDYFAILYQQLEVKPFDRYIPESEVTPLGLQTVREQLAKGVYRESDGAVVFDGKTEGLHTRVFINSAGLPTYETKDVGLSLTKWRDYHFDQSIIITANEQLQYMQVVIASIARFEPEPAKRTKHLVHGVVKMQGGVKMSSRKGNIVTALQILEAARQAGAANNQLHTNPSEETILAAVKYAFAKNRIGGDIVYDPKESISLEGNSGPYLQYAHARARSILRKAFVSADKAGNIVSADDIGGLQPGERSLLRKIGEYPETVDQAVTELMPHYICTYLYDLAQTFNRFYEKNLVVGDPRQALRLQLVEQYADTLRHGLDLLGIVAPEQM